MGQGGMVVLEGRYSIGCVNMVGIGSGNGVVVVDVEKWPVYGV